MKNDGCELAALIRIHDLRLAVVAHGIFQNFDTRTGLDRHRQPPSQILASEPVQHREQIDKTARHKNVGNVHGPKLVRALHSQCS